MIDELIIREEVRYTEEALEFLVRSRVDDKLCTIITTNHAPAYIEKKFPALLSALKEAVLPIKVTGHNFRDKIAEELT